MSQSEPEPIEFSDPVIENSVREILGFADDQNISQVDLDGMDSFYLADDGQPTSLSDLSQFVNLEYLYLDFIGDIDLSPIWDLNQSLRVLEISGSNEAQLEDIPNMPNIFTLGLEGNKITSLDFLKDNNFTSLTFMGLGENYLDLNATSVVNTLDELKDKHPDAYIDTETMLPKGFQNLTSEKSRVSGSNDPEDILLRGIYELLGIFESTGANSLQEFAVSIGVEESVRGFLLSDFSAIDSYEADLDMNLQSRELAEYFQNSFIPALERADAAFSQIKVSETIILEQGLTGSDEIIAVDQADIYVLRAITNLAAALASIQSGYDWDFRAEQVDGLDADDNVSAESLRGLNPNFAGIRSAGQLAKGKGFLSNAIDQYEMASPLLRDQNRTDDRLFTLSADELEDETDFLESLLEMEEAMVGMMELDEEENLDLNAFFSGKVNLANLLPANDGDKFETFIVDDPTMGGLLPDWNQRRVKEEMLEADLVADPKIVFINPEDQSPLVVQYGDEYFWADSLDEADANFTFWTVGEINNILTQGTLQINGNKGYSQDGLLDLSQPGTRNQIGNDRDLALPSESNFTVDAFGDLQLAEEGETQTIAVLSWDANGTWIQAQFSGSVSSVQKIFFNKEEAEAFYLEELGKVSEEILEGWLWYDEYPWVWSSKNENWYYFQVMAMGSGDELGLQFYNAKTKNWNRAYGPESYLTDYAPDNVTGWEVNVSLDDNSSYTLSFSLEDLNHSVTIRTGSTDEEWGYELQSSLGESGVVYLQMFGPAPDFQFYEDKYYFQTPTSGLVTRQERDATDFTPKAGVLAGTFNVTSKPIAKESVKDFTWSEYDDFTQYSNDEDLNQSIWSPYHFYGADTPEVYENKLILSTETADENATLPTGAEDIDAFLGLAEEKDPENLAIINDSEGVYGIQATIDFDGQGSPGAAFQVFMLNTTGSGHPGVAAEVMIEAVAPMLYLEVEGSDEDINGTAFHPGKRTLAITYVGDRISFWLDGDEVKSVDALNFSPDMIGVGAFHDRWDENSDGSYAFEFESIQVLKKPTHPQGWMWADYYPWAYSHDESDWLYFGLARDKAGVPGMIYWNANSDAWKHYTVD